MKRKDKRKDNKVINIIKEHIRNNMKEYLIISIIFLIGIVVGVVFINNIKIEEQQKINNYLNTFIQSLKTNCQIDSNNLIRNSIISNIILAFAMWFIGSTIIGIPIVCLLVGFKGFCLGYTISSIMVTFGVQKGIIFTILSLLLQNIIFIPCILALAVSGIKVCKSIIKDKRKENIKTELYRHTAFCIILTIFLVISCFIETYISTNLVVLTINYI